MERKIQNVFLVGTARSGTTLLQGLLNGIDSIVSYPESHFFRVEFSSRGINQLTEMLPSINQNIKQYDFSVRFHRRRRIKMFINSMDATTESLGATIWIEKTPMHLHYIRQIERYVNGTRFIHIVRDPFDAIPSLVDVTRRYPDAWGGTRSVYDCIKRWNKDIQITYSQKSRKTHHIVIFDMLIHDTEKILNQTLKYLGFEHHSFSIRQEPSRIISLSEPWKNRNYQNIGIPESKLNLLSLEEQSLIRQLSRIDLYNILKHRALSQEI